MEQLIEELNIELQLLYREDMAIDPDTADRKWTHAFKLLSELRERSSQASLALSGGQA